MKKRRVFLGASIGLTVGLLLDGLLLINSSVWMISFIFPVVLPPLLGIVVGLVLGAKGLVPASPWYVPLVIVLISPAAVWGPIKAQEWRFRCFTQGLPDYGGSDRRITEISVLGGDDPPRVSIEFETKHTSFPQLIQFYRDHLVKEGWDELEPEKEYKRDTWYKFRKGHNTVHLIAFQGGKWGDRQCVRVTRWHSTLFYR